MRILTAAETRELDRVAIEDHGIPGLLLMEHASLAVSNAARSVLREGGEVFVLAGGGGNGGDGFAAARLLAAAGSKVRVLAVVPVEKLSGDAAINAAIWARFEGGVVRPFQAGALDAARAGDVVVDALLGTGLSRPAEGLFAQAIEAIGHASSRGARVVSVDVPSGVSADTGRALGPVVRADITVTFGALKQGLVLHPGAELAGDVRVADISWPPRALEDLAPALRLLDEGAIRAMLPGRDPDTHKGSFGHCLVVAGSFAKSGAAALASTSALRGGAGLASVAVRAEVIPQILAHAMEVMAIPLEGSGPLSLQDLPALEAAAKGKHALLIGPGIPRGDETAALLGRFLAEADPGCPVVLDADALNALAEQPSLLDSAAPPLVLTPHPGEMARLAGISIAEVQEDRTGIARSFAKAHRCTVVLKGAGTVIADPDGEAAISKSGNAGMATAGSGDVLGGLIAALLAQGLAPAAAARIGVYVHGLAGDRLAERRGQKGLVASDLLDGITEVWASWGL